MNRVKLHPYVEYSKRTIQHDAFVYFIKGHIASNIALRKMTFAEVVYELSSDELKDMGFNKKMEFKNKMGLKENEIIIFIQYLNKN
jgi:predicted metal-dependent peptidase